MVRRLCIILMLSALHLSLYCMQKAGMLLANISATTIASAIEKRFETNADLNTPLKEINIQNAPLLALIIHDSQADLFKRLVYSDIPINLEVHNVYSNAIHRAALFKAPKNLAIFLDFLTTHNPEVKRRLMTEYNYHGYPPLHCAAVGRSPECTQILLSHGADCLGLNNKTGETALQSLCKTIVHPDQIPHIKKIITLLALHGAPIGHLENAIDLLKCLQRQCMPLALKGIYRGLVSEDQLEDLIQAYKDTIPKKLVLVHALKSMGRDHSLFLHLLPPELVCYIASFIADVPVPHN